MFHLASIHRPQIDVADSSEDRLGILTSILFNLMELVTESSSLQCTTLDYCQVATRHHCSMTALIIIYYDIITSSCTLNPHCPIIHYTAGLNRESWAVDYGGGLNMLQSLELASRQNEENGVKINGQKIQKQKSQFVLLSAFCCGKPVLQFQFAKIKLEDEIRKVTDETGLTHSIVRPTAYFKSLDGQIESAKKGRSRSAT
jgi:hypothetical protein